MINTKYKTEDFIRAKEVCAGSRNGASDIRFFNEFFITMKKEVEREYKLGTKELKNNKVKREYVIYEQGEIISTGEFLFSSLSTWDPERSNFPTYIHRRLNEFQMKIPAKWEDDPDAARIIQKLKQIARKNNEDPTSSNLLELAKKYMPKSNVDSILYANANYNDSMMSLNASPTSVDEDSDSVLLSEMISADEQDEPIFDPTEVLAQVFPIFNSLQKRVQSSISMYLSVLVMDTLWPNYDIEKIMELKKKYPNMLEHVEWVYSIRLKTATDDNPNGEIPSLSKQAEYLGKSYNAYCNTISSWEKKVKQLKTNRQLRID